MLFYIFILLCYSATAYPKYISTTAHIKQLQNNFLKMNYAPLGLEVSPSSQLLKSLQRVPSPDTTARLLELKKFRDDFNKEKPKAIVVESKKQLGLEDVVEEIQSHRFTEAEIILRQMDFIDKIPEIVHTVYNNSESNADILLDFGHDLTNIELACSVLFALWNEMKTNDHRDVHKMIDVVNQIELKLLILNGSPEWKAKAKVVTKETISDITSASVEILKVAMISANYRNNTQVKRLADSLFKLDSDRNVFDEVIQKVVNESFSEVSAVEIAQNVYSHTFISQIISGLQELFKKLENLDNLNNPAVLNIGEYLKVIKDMPNYANLSKSKKESVDVMIQKMPICARNLFFEPFVCIWNRGKGEYLYVASSEFNRNEDKRSVFTRTTGEPVGPGVWIVEKSGDEFFFKNKAYENEYLFAASGMHNKEDRFVHTSTEGGKVGNKSSWKIELEGDVCYLQNVNYHEYLFASDRLSGDKSRYTFTWIPKTSAKIIENFQWQIRSCDMSAILKRGV